MPAVSDAATWAVAASMIEKSFPLALLWWYVVVLALRLPPPAGRPARPGPR